MWIGIETSPNEIRKVGFNHLREPDMEREPGKVQRVLAGDARFGGFVLHHFSSYQKWLQKSERPALLITVLIDLQRARPQVYFCQLPLRFMVPHWLSFWVTQRYSPTMRHQQLSWR